MINHKSLQKFYKIITMIGVLLMIWFFIYIYQSGALESRTNLEQFMSDLGILAPITFVFIQIVQTVIPFIPATLTIPMGTILFGDITGFLLNYGAIVFGSIFNFYIARRYGSQLVATIVGEENYEKGMSWLDKGRHFNRIFFVSMVQPISPGDLMCYIAGLSKMTWRYFLVTIGIGKITTLLIYLVGTKTIVEFIFSLF